MFLFNSSLITQNGEKIRLGIKDQNLETVLSSTEVLESHLLLEPMNSEAPSKQQGCLLKGKMKV